MSNTLIHCFANFAKNSIFIIILSVSFTLYSQENLLKNGDFKIDANGDGIPDGWSSQKDVSFPSENGKRWLKIDGGQISLNLKIPIDPQWRMLMLSFKARYKDVVLGDQEWKTARMAMCFNDKNGKRVGEWPDVWGATGSSDGWITFKREYKIPAGADHLALSPANFGKSGAVEFSDIVLKVVSINYKGDMPKPEDADKEPWDMENAWRNKNDTQEKICINGLWRVLPEVSGNTLPPSEGAGWGWFKVPGVWPTQDWTSADATQKFLLPPMVEDILAGKMIEQVWYKRDVIIPTVWNGRKIYLDFTLLQTNARIFIDGKDAGELWFPGGRFDLTSFAIPGKKQTVTILVTARPIEAETKIFMAPDRIVSNKANVKFKGIAGDLYLCSEPKSNSIQDLHVMTSVSEGKISFKTKIGSPSNGNYVLSAEVLDRSGKEVKSFRSDKISFSQGRNEYVFGGEWKDALLWDTGSPQNIYTVIVSLEDVDGRKLDEMLPVKFGFREFKIDGKDFYLNGKLIRLRSLWVNSIADFADKSDYEAGMNLCKRMKEYGFNFFITGNYDFEPGDVAYMDSIFDAADDSGMLSSFSLPHIKDFKWLNSDAAVKNYGELTEWLISRMKNHPSIVMYAMNHNANGYHGDQNPLKMDGVYDPEKVPGEMEKVGSNDSFLENRAKSEKAASISKSLDPTRPVYHHQCGNLGDIYTVNCYLNWAPRQERSEWMEHWNKAGIKPFFFVEWGLPHIASWSSYRGPEFIWRCEAFQSCWDSEFASSITGESAYEMTPEKIRLIDAEEKSYSAGKPFRWNDVFVRILSNMEKNHREIMAYYSSDNWRAHRAWGVSAMLPWDQAELWQRVKDTPDRDNPGKFNNLQKPGTVPDFLRRGSQYIHDFGDEDNFKASSIGNVFLRNNRECLGFIGGCPMFADKYHNFAAGENISKQIVLINDSRENKKCVYSWKMEDAGLNGSGESDLKPGEIKFVPVNLKMPIGMDKRSIKAEFDFAGEKQADLFSLNLVKTGNAKISMSSKVLLFDPDGITGKSLDAVGISYLKINSPAEAAIGDILVIGRNALSKKEPLYDLKKVADGLKVIVFEQDDASFFNKIGFRVNVQGIRNSFIRVREHPILDGVNDDMLRDWRGSATLTSPNLDVDEFERKDPRWEWCGFYNTRVWRCGNRGNVCSVMIEKPEMGNWLPILDCGFDLQYSPLLEYSEGRGKVIFCQLDVSGRTENEPATSIIMENIFKYLDTAKPGKTRQVFYSGDKNGEDLLKNLGINFSVLQNGVTPAANSLLVAGPGASIDNMKDAVNSGLNLLGLGLDMKSISTILPDTVKMKKLSAYSSIVKELGSPEFTGVSNSELHWRGKLDFYGFTEKDDSSCDMLKSVKIGSGVAVFCQVAPWDIDYVKKPYFRTSYRRNVFLVSRLLANLGASSESPLLANFARSPVNAKFQLAKDWVGEADKDNKGESNGWAKEEFNDSAWRQIQVPGMFDVLRKELDGYDGYFWYRLRFKTPKGFNPEEKLVLKMGAIDDESWIWLNGKFLGELTKGTNPKDYWSAQRTYGLKPGTLRKDGDNTIIVKVNDLYLNGGFKDIPFLEKNGAPWLNTYYLQEPVADDDPYRYYRW